MRVLLTDTSVSAAAFVVVNGEDSRRSGGRADAKASCRSGRGRADPSRVEPVVAGQTATRSALIFWLHYLL